MSPLRYLRKQGRSFFLFIFEILLVSSDAVAGLIPYVPGEESLVTSKRPDDS
jgi:hypothetical protein